MTTGETNAAGDLRPLGGAGARGRPAPPGPRCPVCADTHSVALAQAAAVPACNLAWPTRDAALRAPLGALDVRFCVTCGMGFNAAFDQRLVANSDGRDVALPVSPRAQAYTSSLLARLHTRYALRNREVVDLGCGPGEFLAALCERGANRGLGFDRRVNRHSQFALSAGAVHLVADDYSPKYGALPADLVYSRRLLERTATPSVALAMVARGMAARPSSHLFLEVSNLLTTLRKGSVWDFNYERAGYFTPHAMAHLLRESGFVTRRLYATFGGQFLCAEAYPMRRRLGWLLPEHPLTEQVAALAAGFHTRLRNRLAYWNDRLERWTATGRRVVVWGGGTKGQTFLALVSAARALEYVVDVDPHLAGLYLGGTGQQIVAPSFLVDYRPDVVIAMNPLYRREIRTQLAGLGLQPDVVSG